MQFERRETGKTYVALAAGHPPKDAGEIDLPIRKDLVNTPLQIVDFAHGRPSVTRWDVRERLESPARTRFGLMPVTGRSHQLRVHLLAIGHPILGDDLYAPPEVKAMSPRLCLHAERLEFTHPATGSRVAFEARAEF
jgi:tRNA pseudouridine32 synthase/23S rRNA pseudouridine746 synthase